MFCRVLLVAIAAMSGLSIAPRATAQPSDQSTAVPFTTITGGEAGEAQSLTAKGGTFPAALYKEWFAAYQAKIGVKVDYQAVGSGAGIKAITQGNVDFAGSDAPMTDKQLRLAKYGPVLHIPTAFGAIAVVYNVPGIQGQLRFTAQDISGIYLGEITQWNDGRLLADNPQLSKITQPIIVVHRSDGSGSTYGFTDYLNANNKLWQLWSNKGTSANWPVGIGGMGATGLAELVKTNPFSIGYAEVGFAKKANLAYGLVKNSAGRFVAPDDAAIAAAAAASGQRSPSDLRFSVVNAPGAESYPICTGTWLLVYRNFKDQSKAQALTRLLWWATHDAQTVNASLGYARLPAALVARSELLIREINVGGKRAFNGP